MFVSYFLLFLFLVQLFLHLIYVLLQVLQFFLLVHKISDLLVIILHLDIMYLHLSIEFFLWNLDLLMLLYYLYLTIDNFGLVDNFDSEFLWYCCVVCPDVFLNPPYKKYIYGNDTVYIWFIYVFINSVFKFRIFNKDLIFCNFIKTRIFKPYMQIIRFAYVIYKPYIYKPYIPNVLYT